MARIRTIKPEFWTDETLADCSLPARLLFVGTWNIADDHGNLERSSKQLKAQLFPYDPVDCEALVVELLKVERLIEYEVDGRKYLHIKNFDRHQKIDKKSKPRVPVYEDSARVRRDFDEDSTRKGREGKGKEGKGTEADGGEDSPPVPAPQPSRPDEPKTVGRNVEIAVQLRKWEGERNKAPKITSSDPRVIAWATQGVTDQQLREAYDLAIADRKVAGEDKAINAGFLDVFVAKLIAPSAGQAAAQSAVRRKPWFLAWPGIVEKGAEFGLTETGFDTAPAFRDAVFAKAGVTREQFERAERDHAPRG